jgi:hypothetical protein
VNRRTVRYLAAIASAATAALYFGIGAGILTVVEASPDAPDLFEFGVAAGGAFVVGAVLLLAFDRRVLWVLGAALQVGVIVMYVVVASERTPPFEAWGLLIKLLQVVVLIALAYLVVHPRLAKPAA